MTLQALSAHATDYGVGHAIVHLSPGTSRDHLLELAGHFAHGWGDAGSQQQLGDLHPDDRTPLVQQLLRGVHPSDSHMLYLPNLNVAYGAVTRDGLELLQRHSAIETIRHSMPILPVERVGDAVPVDQPVEEIAWGIKRLGAPALWEKGFTGQGVLIAHLDTGVDSTHPSLQGAVTHHVVYDGEGHATSPVDPYLDSSEDGHGTATAGILVGREVTGNPSVGMAPGANLACGTVIRDPDTVARLLSGMDWAIEVEARLLSLSIGYSGYNDALVEVMEKLRANKILPVVCIGNDSAETKSPGNYPTALSVGATNQDDTVAPFSGFHMQGQEGVGPLLCAPGTHIMTTASDSGFATEYGTSSAAPHVAGLAALLMQARPDATIDQVQDAILDSCDNPADQDSQSIGRGIPNGEAALENLMSF